MTTYATLKADVGDWYNHASVVSVVASLVRLAEAQIRRDVRVAAMESVATGTMSAGVITLDVGVVDLRRLVVDGYVYELVTAERYQELETAGSEGRYFTRIGNALHVLNGGDGAYSLLYRSRFAALSADSDTNWLLTNAYDVYLFAALKQAAVYMKDVAAAQSYASLYDGAVGALNGAESVSAYSGGGLTMTVGDSV